MASVSMMVVDDCIDGCKDCHSGICYPFQSWRILLQDLYGFFLPRVSLLIKDLLVAGV